MRIRSPLIFFIFFSVTEVRGQINSFSRQQLSADLRFMVGSIENVHPNPFHDISKEKFDVLTDSVSKTFRDGMGVQDAWPGFSFILALLNEGHGSIEYPQELLRQIKADSASLFPVLVKEFDGEKFIVRYDLSADSLLHTGDYITSINGRSVADWMRYFTSFYGGLANWRNLQVIRDLSGTLVLHKVAGPYTIEYINRGEKKKAVINGVTFSALLNRAAEVRKNNSITTTPLFNYSFSRLENNAGYINFRSMRDMDAFTRFLDSVFMDIKNNPVNGLIIDLRQNGGGNSALGEKLLSCITDRRFRMGGGSKWKVSDDYKIFVQEQAITNKVYASGSFQNYLKKESGTIISQDGERPYSNSNKELLYKGKVCVLIGPNTFSSANMLANAIGDYQLATLIGEPTGEAPNDYGELYWNKLPNTGLRFFTCSKQFIRANGNAGDTNPVLPDIEKKSNPNSLKDEVLEFAKEWVQKK